MKKISFRKGLKKRQLRRRPINVLASALTTAGLYCGIASIFAAIDQNFEKAGYFIFAALVFDSVDGTVAKLTKSVSEFGKQLDSLCDLVSFGAAPAVLIYTAYLHEYSLGGKTGAVFAVLYVICAALRLARYNVYQSEMREYFVGLPTPGAAVTIASLVLFTNYLKLQVAFYFLLPMTLGLAFLMVSTLRYPKDKMKSMILRPRSAFRFLVLCAIGFAVVHKAIETSPAIVLFPATASYALYGIGDALYRRVLRTFLGPAKSTAAASSHSEGVPAGTAGFPGPAASGSPPRKIDDLL